MECGEVMYYPVMLNIRRKVIAVIGGGKVALRKVKGLMEYEPCIKVISPEFDEGFEELENKVLLIKENYNEVLIKDAFLVIAATSSREINHEISVYCEKNRILCNTSDDSAGSTFIIPSSFKRGDLQIAVSTSGKSPTLAAKIKSELEEKYTEEYGEYLNLLGEIRELVIKKCTDIALRKKILNELINIGFEELKSRRDEYESCDWIKGE